MFYAIQTARVIFTAKKQSLGDQIYEMKCLFVAVGRNALFIVLPH